MSFHYPKSCIGDEEGPGSRPWDVPSREIHSALGNHPYSEPRGRNPASNHPLSPAFYSGPFVWDSRHRHYDPVVLKRHNVIPHILANDRAVLKWKLCCHCDGNTAFIWELPCHWLKSLKHYRNLRWHFVNRTLETPKNKSKYISLSRTCIWKCHLKKYRPFCSDCNGLILQHSFVQFLFA